MRCKTCCRSTEALRTAFYSLFSASLPLSARELKRNNLYVIEAIMKDVFARVVPHPHLSSPPLEEGGGGEQLQKIYSYLLKYFSYFSRQIFSLCVCVFLCLCAEIGVGPNPARLASIGGGVPVSVPVLSVNVRCGSHLKALIMGGCGYGKCGLLQGCGKRHGPDFGPPISLFFNHFLTKIL